MGTSPVLRFFGLTTTQDDEQKYDEYVGQLTLIQFHADVAVLCLAARVRTSVCFPATMSVIQTLRFGAWTDHHLAVMFVASTAFGNALTNST